MVWPALTGRRRAALDKWSPLVTFTAALAVYVTTLPRTLTWANFGGDGGELITAAATLGIPHPPGYPTYVLLGKLVTWLPIGTVAYRFHLFSAVAMATAAALVTAVIRRHSDGRVAPAVAAALVLAWSPLVWGQAIIAEVYALNMAVIALLLAALAYQRHRLAGIALGLSLTTHLTGLLLIPLALSQTPRRAWPSLAAGGLLGLAPTLALPLLAHGNSPVMWGEATTLSGWWWLVSGQLYRPNLLAVPIDLWAERLVTWLSLMIRQMGSVGWVLMPFAFARRSRLPLALTLTAGLYFLYAFTYDSDDAVVNLLPALLVVSILLGFALSRLPAPFLLLPLLLLGLHYSDQDLSRETVVEDAAIRLFEEAPQDAILLSKGDPALFTIWYYHYVEGRRPDIIPIDEWLFAFEWRRDRLRYLNPTLFVPESYDLTAFGEANGRRHPVCRVDDRLRLQSCE